VFAPNRGVGRPGAYCRRSCRQRAYEQRRHAGDQAWSDARLIRLSEQLARYEDAIDRVQELLEELRADEVDERTLEPGPLIERLETAVDLQPEG
jgi:hypothetical protein